MCISLRSGMRGRKKRLAAVALATLLSPVGVLAAMPETAPVERGMYSRAIPPAPVAAAVPEAAVVGEGIYSYLFWDLYTATLYAPRGVWQDGQPFALRLRYLTNLKGRKIAAASRDEIARQNVATEAQLTAWEQQMAAIFPDVGPGRTLTGVVSQDGHTRFYDGDREVGTIADPAFGKAFFNIWLGESTRDPALRARLLGVEKE